ncbi:MAG: hypothetical protein JO258_09465, partial [Alphaproteobacteria bacterium]|nr:hypothetical protein [Alphaproteobacteria bacterium]
MASTTWINASGGDWFDPASWSNGVPASGDDAIINATGSVGGYTITIAAGATVTVNSVAVEDGNATLKVAGTLATSTIAVDAGTLDLAGGTIENATITTGATGHLNLAGFGGGGSLAGVTIETPLSITNAAVVATGLHVTGAGGAGAGTVDLTGSSRSILDFQGSQTFDNATINIGDTFGESFGGPQLAAGDPSGSNSTPTTGGAATVLTLGDSTSTSNTTVHLTGSVAELGGDGKITNFAQIDATFQNGKLLIDPANFENHAKIEIGGTVVNHTNNTTTTTHITSTVTIGNNFLVVGSGKSQQTQWSSSGLIEVGAGSHLNLDGMFDGASLSHINNFNAPSTASEAIVINGTAQNPGTIVVGGTSPIGQVELSFEGKIQGGTIQDEGQGFYYAGGTLDGVTTYEGTLDMSEKSALLTIVPAPLSPGSPAGVLPSITFFTPHSPGPSGPGGVALTGQGAQLNIAGSFEFNNVVVDIGHAGANTPQNTDIIDDQTNTGGTVLDFSATSEIDQTGPIAIIEQTAAGFGEGAAINTSGTGGPPSPPVPNQIVLEGIVNAQTAATTVTTPAVFDIATGSAGIGGQVVNKGKINVGANTDLVLSSLDNTAGGSITVGAGGAAYLGFGYFPGNGINFGGGTLTNAGTITLAPATPASQTAPAEPAGALFIDGSFTDATLQAFLANVHNPGGGVITFDGTLDQTDQTDPATAPNLSGIVLGPNGRID